MTNAQYAPGSDIIATRTITGLGVIELRGSRVGDVVTHAVRFVRTDRGPLEASGTSPYLAWAQTRIERLDADEDVTGPWNVTTSYMFDNLLALDESTPDAEVADTSAADRLLMTFAVAYANAVALEKIANT